MLTDGDFQNQSITLIEQDILFIRVCQIFKMKGFRGGEVPVNILSWKKIIKKMFWNNIFNWLIPFFPLNFQFVKIMNIFSK